MIRPGPVSLRAARPGKAPAVSPCRKPGRPDNPEGGSPVIRWWYPTDAWMPGEEVRVEDEERDDGDERDDSRLS